MSSIPRRAAGVLAVLAVAVVIAAPKLLDLRRTSSAPGGASMTETALQVRAYRVEPTELTEQLSTTGTIRANEEVEIVSEISGKISSIHFDEGSRVRAGELLLKIDDSELLAERQRALYRVELAERDEARQKQLLEDGVIAREAYDVALGELNVLRAELQLIEAQLLKTEIRAPFNGVIGLRWVSPGSYLSSQTRIASLKDLDPVKLDFTVPEKYSGLMQVGDRISFTVGSSDRTFDGTIYAVEPGIEASTRSLRVRARCPNHNGALVPGAFANVTLVLRSVADALTVPSIAVIPELGGKKVFVYEDGLAQSRSVETGIRSQNEVQVTSGLIEGDLVITTGLLQLQPGAEVEIEEVETKTGSAP
jgi:membrane fusion protein (multidrug efflux system)